MSLQRELKKRRPFESLEQEATGKTIHDLTKDQIHVALILPRHGGTNWLRGTPLASAGVRMHHKHASPRCSTWSPLQSKSGL